MSFQHPFLVVVALMAGSGLAAGYVWLQRERARALAAAGLHPPTGGWRRHMPPAAFLIAVTLALLAVGRPHATVPVPRASGTVVLAFDVSNSMAAKDVEPSRLGAAQEAAISFVQAQPDRVDVGVVAFNQGALTTFLPTNDRDGTIAAIKRLTVAGGTSLGQAILASVTLIVGKTVTLTDASDPTEPPDLGFWPSATIVLLSDGEETGGPDAIAAAELAATAGIHIDTVGVGTAEGTTVEVDGFQVATALNEPLLTEVAESTGGSYHQAANAEALAAIAQSLDLRITVHDRRVELTGAAVGIALLLLTIGALLMITWSGRIL